MTVDMSTCHQCGYEGTVQEVAQHVCETTNVSVSADTMEADLERKIEAASLPNLSTLFGQAQDQGIIKPQVIGSGQPT